MATGPTRRDCGLFRGVLAKVRFRPACIRPARIRPARIRPACIRPAHIRPAPRRPACLRPALLFWALLFLAAVGPARADLGGYRILAFHTDLSVRPDADLLVTERLEVEFSEPRHGIYRSIPVRYNDPRGYGYEFSLRLLGVEDGDGRELGTKVTQQSRYVRIRIGDADRTVEGRVSYVIRYRVRDALASFGGHDELYWNATGTEWDVPILRASATVELPAPLPADSIVAAAYTGPFGSREQAARVVVSAPGRIDYEADGSLDPLEGLTVVAAWPRGHVRFPGAATQAARLFGNYWIVLAPLAALAWLWRRYRLVGRDPEPAGSIAVRYEPPAGMTPAEVGTLVDEKVDLADITATVVDLAVRGHLRIQMEEESRLFGALKREETVLYRTVPAPAGPLAPHEQQVMDGLFESGDRVETSDLKEAFYVKIPGIRQAVYGRLVATRNLAAPPDRVRTRYVGAGIAAGVVVALAGGAWLALRGFALPFLIPAFAGVATLLAFAFFAPAMPRRTQSGARLRAWALGFEEFVNRVEADRLERTQAREAFERLLPYAIALGVSRSWARRFEGIYEDRPPSWYAGPHLASGFSTRSFERSLASSMGTLGASLTASPRSSSGSSGGGGFSGGGGGGGGGGSW